MAAGVVNLESKTSYGFKSLKQKLASELQRDIERIYAESLFSDTDVFIDNICIKLHSCILKARVPKFYAILLQEIQHTQLVSAQEVTDFLRSAYTEHNIKEKEAEFLKQYKNRLLRSPSTERCFDDATVTEDIESFSSRNCTLNNLYYSLVHLDDSADSTSDCSDIVDQQLLLNADCYRSSLMASSEKPVSENIIVEADASQSDNVKHDTAFLCAARNENTLHLCHDSKDDNTDKDITTSGKICRDAEEPDTDVSDTPCRKDCCVSESSGSCCDDSSGVPKCMNTSIEKTNFAEPASENMVPFEGHTSVFLDDDETVRLLKTLNEVNQNVASYSCNKSKQSGFHMCKTNLCSYAIPKINSANSVVDGKTNLFIDASSLLDDTGAVCPSINFNPKLEVQKNTDAGNETDNEDMHTPDSLNGDNTSVLDKDYQNNNAGNDSYVTSIFESNEEGIERGRKSVVGEKTNREESGAKEKGTQFFVNLKSPEKHPVPITSSSGSSEPPTANKECDGSRMQSKALFSMFIDLKSPQNGNTHFTDTKSVPGGVSEHTKYAQKLTSTSVAVEDHINNKLGTKKQKFFTFIEPDEKGFVRHRNPPKISKPSERRSWYEGKIPPLESLKKQHRSKSASSDNVTDTLMSQSTMSPESRDKGITQICRDNAVVLNSPTVKVWTQNGINLNISSDKTAGKSTRDNSVEENEGISKNVGSVKGSTNYGAGNSIIVSENTKCDATINEYEKCLASGNIRHLYSGLGSTYSDQETVKKCEMDTLPTDLLNQQSNITSVSVTGDAESREKQGTPDVSGSVTSSITKDLTVTSTINSSNMPPLTNVSGSFPSFPNSVNVLQKPKNYMEVSDISEKRIKETCSAQSESSLIPSSEIAKSEKHSAEHTTPQNEWLSKLRSLSDRLRSVPVSRRSSHDTTTYSDTTNIPKNVEEGKKSSALSTSWTLVFGSSAKTGPQCRSFKGSQKGFKVTSVSGNKASTCDTERSDSGVMSSESKTDSSKLSKSCGFFVDISGTKQAISEEHSASSKQLFSMFIDFDNKQDSSDTEQFGATQPASSSCVKRKSQRQSRPCNRVTRSEHADINAHEKNAPVNKLSISEYDYENVIAPPSSRILTGASSSSVDLSGQSKEVPLAAHVPTNAKTGLRKYTELTSRVEKMEPNSEVLSEHRKTRRNVKGISLVSKHEARNVMPEGEKTSSEEKQADVKTPGADLRNRCIDRRKTYKISETVFNVSEFSPILHDSKVSSHPVIEDQTSFVKLSDMDKGLPVISRSVSEKKSSSSTTVSRMSKSIPDSSWLENKLLSRSANSRSLSRIFPHLSASVLSKTSDDTTNSTISSMQSSTDPLGFEGSVEGSDDHSGTTNTLGQDLLRMFLDEISPDVIIEVAGRRIKAHKCILSSRCQYFAAMLSGGWVESAGNVISLHGFTYNVVHFALCHIYSGEGEIPDSINIVELATLADMLCLEGLKEVISYTLKSKYCHFFHKPCNVCAVGVLECLPVAAAYGLDEIYRKSLLWITRYYVRLWPTKPFANLPREIIDKCYKQQVANANVDNVLDVLINCEKLLSVLPKSRWAEPSIAVTTRLHDYCIKFISQHFIDFVKSETFSSLPIRRTWAVNIVTEKMWLVCEKMSLDDMCYGYSTVHQLLKAAQAEKTVCNMDWIEMLTKVEEQMEQVLVKQANQACRCSAWFELDSELRHKIQSNAGIVFLVSDTNLRLKNFTSIQRNGAPKARSKSLSNQSLVSSSYKTPTSDKRRPEQRGKAAEDATSSRTKEEVRFSNNATAKPKPLNKLSEVKPRYLEKRQPRKEQTSESGKKAITPVTERPKNSARSAVAVLVKSATASKTSSPALKTAPSTHSSRSQNAIHDAKGHQLSSSSIKSSSLPNSSLSVSCTEKKGRYTPKKPMSLQNSEEKKNVKINGRSTSAKDHSPWITSLRVSNIKNSRAASADSASVKPKQDRAASSTTRSSKQVTVSKNNTHKPLLPPNVSNPPNKKGRAPKKDASRDNVAVTEDDTHHVTQKPIVQLSRSGTFSKDEPTLLKKPE